jgi:heme/copper-type cytochrome/quinol oxidase subunit 4
MQKNWWESQGFLFSAIMTIGSFWGITEGVANASALAIVGAFGAFAAVQQFFKTSKFKGFVQTIKDGNTIQYAVAAVAVFIPNAGALYQPLQGLADAFISKNFGLIVSGLVSAGVAIYNIFFKKQ